MSTSQVDPLPELKVTGDFYVEVISHTEDISSSGSQVLLYILFDPIVTSDQRSGFSRDGKIDEKILSNMISKDPAFSHFNWLFIVRGLGAPMPSSK